jgi:16S rRNA (cytosine1402-N4)-methyltransferase
MELHRPVMLAQALAGLAVSPGGIYVDATFGRGGHSAAILEQLAGSGALHAFDQDPEACAHAWKHFGGVQNFRVHAHNFDQLAVVAQAEGIAGKINGILFDLGVSSPQFDDAARGFSFSKNGPLDMRMDPRSGESAAEWLARATDTEIADVLFRYGEERDSRRIARVLVAARSEAPITTTAQLAKIILDAHRGPRQKIHPATRSFQAIRIHINRELERLSSALEQALQLLAPGGRLAVISFHSLEDRIVKRYLREQARAVGDAFSPTGTVHAPARIRVLRKQLPDAAELAANPRARSAVLRVAEKLTSGAGL